MFLEKFDAGVRIDRHLAWNTAREFLDVLDCEIAKILSRRSVAYWLHVYRRIGVFLSPKHENSTDPTTIGLVRKIVELSIQKHGNLTASGEFADTRTISPDHVMGGWMKRGLKALASKNESGEKVFRQYSRVLKSRSEIVLRDFGKKDFLSIYEVEGAAYQYWLITALMRSIGKGAAVKIDDHGDWVYIRDAELNRLIKSFDQRNSSHKNNFSSLLGIWVDDEVISESPLEMEIEGSDRTEIRSLGTVFFPTYNVLRSELSGVDTFGKPIPKGVRTNFLPCYFHVARFLEKHKFMEPEFVKKWGYGFEVFLNVLAALSSFSILPEKALNSIDEEAAKAVIQEQFVQTLFRGYSVFRGSNDYLCEIIAERVRLIFNKEPSSEQIRLVISNLSLSLEKQRNISQWSGGPSYPIIENNELKVINFVPTPSILSTLFVFMSDGDGVSGSIFEKAFQNSIIHRGFRLTKGQILAFSGGVREIDAAVLLDNTLFLFECVSIERPLDFEIGVFERINNRNERLKEKLTQVETLRTFIENNALGKNYDFSNVGRIEHFVVSPFVEWVWSEESELWTDFGLPRLLSAGEALSLLETWE